MTTSPRTQVRPLTEAAEDQAQRLPPARYRLLGDVIRLHVEPPVSVDHYDRADDTR
jgi:hypothetical protein